ncbi:hypothetical protein BH09ACT10_BH09ACT10_25810 [soil metagenome]
MLMVALVAMLLVATGGSARASQQRVTIGTGHVSSVPHASRHAYVVAPSHHDHGPLHLDLDATLPSSPAGPTDSGTYDTGPVTDAHGAARAITPLGRAPPAL